MTIKSLNFFILDDYYQAIHKNISEDDYFHALSVKMMDKWWIWIFSDEYYSILKNIL